MIAILHAMKRGVKKQQGFFLIEVIVAASVIAVVLVLLLGAIQNSIEVSERALERTQAAYLLEEGAEVLKAIRDNDWDTIAGLTTIPIIQHGMVVVGRYLLPQILLENLLEVLCVLLLLVMQEMILSKVVVLLTVEVKNVLLVLFGKLLQELKLNF